MRKVLKVLIIAVVLAIVVAACSSASGGGSTTTSEAEQVTTTSEAEQVTTTSEAEQVTTTAVALPAVCRGQNGAGMKVGFANLSESSDFAVLVREGIQKVAADCNVQLVVADNDRDPTRTLDNARNFVAQKVDGIIEFNTHRDLGEAICDVIDGRPLLAIDIPQEPCGVFMGADNRAAGEIGGKGAGELAKKLWDCDIDQVVTFEAFSIGGINTDRMNGQLAGLQSVCPDLQLGDFENWTPDVANSIITRLEAYKIDPAFEQGRDYLTAHPDARHIVALCLNDDGCLGFHSAVEEAGRSGQVIFASQGANDATHELIRTDPFWAGGTAYFPERYGEMLIPNIIRMINGEKPEANPLLMKHVFISADNIDDYYPLP